MQAYRDKLIENEIQALKEQLQEIIDKFDLHVENLPYFDYNIEWLDGTDTYMVYVSPPNFY